MNELKLIDLIKFWNDKMKQVRHLSQYFNEQTRKISITYGRTVPVIDKHFSIKNTMKFTQKITDIQKQYLELV